MYKINVQGKVFSVINTLTNNSVHSHWDSLKEASQMATDLNRHLKNLKISSDLHKLSLAAIKGSKTT